MKSTQSVMVLFLVSGAIPSSMSGMSNLPFLGPASPSQSFSLPPNIQPNGCDCEIAIPASPVNNSSFKNFPLSTSTSLSSFAPISLTSARAQPEKGLNQNPQLPSTLPWPFPPGLSLPAPPQSQNATEFPSTQPSSQPRPRLIRSHSVMGNCHF